MEVLRNLLRLAMILVMLLGLASDRQANRKGGTGGAAEGAGGTALEIVVPDREVGDGLRIRLRSGESDYVLDITRPDGTPVRIDGEPRGIPVAAVE